VNTYHEPHFYLIHVMSALQSLVLIDAMVLISGAAYWCSSRMERRVAERCWRRYR
jgi:hypothetical protein